ncbi:ABC transporter permease [Stomatohabitans albus]|uniref:ABC transporter permease n=2 Tax=Stomatohabitans albus TaxID=3110766 RepID=UPI00300C8187
MMRSTLANNSRVRRSIITLAGIIALVLAWTGVAAGQHEYILPSPLSAATAALTVLTKPDFWLALGDTTLRAGMGLCIALVLGACWGTAIGRWPSVEAFCQPAIQILLATPAVVFVVLALVWFGSTSQAVIMVVTLVATPLMVKTTAGAVRNIDPTLNEMGQVFGLSWFDRVRTILIPLVLPPFIASATVAMGQSLRVAVMAELLTTASGLGGAIRLAQINLETPKVFAYALILTSVALMLEKLITGPLQSRTTVQPRQGEATTP